MPTSVVSKQVRLHRHGSIDRLLAIYRPGTRRLAIPGPVTNPRSRHLPMDGPVTRIAAQEASPGCPCTHQPSRSRHPTVPGPVTSPEAVFQPRSHHLVCHPSGGRSAIQDPSPSRYQPQPQSTSHGYFWDPSPDCYRAHYQHGGHSGDCEPSPSPSQPRSRARPVSACVHQCGLLPWIMAITVLVIRPYWRMFSRPLIFQ